jgi:galactokinase
MNLPDFQRAFEAQFGAAPTHVARAPGRINLIGEHTDYNHGFVLPAAIDKAICMAASARPDTRMVFYAQDLHARFECDLSEIQFQSHQTWVNYLLGAVQEVRQGGHHISGFNVLFGGDVPLGAGLSSSAAIECGMLLLLRGLFSLPLSSRDIILMAQRGENNFVGMNCGVMDMFASVMGRKNQVLRLDCRDLSYQYFPFETPDFSLVLFDSGIKHALVESAYNTRRKECETGVQLLSTFDPTIKTLRDVSLSFLQAYRHALPEVIFKRCHFVVEETARVTQACEVLERHDFQELGRLMYASHDGLDAGYEVCVPETNFLVAHGRSSDHVLGARQMGGGFGGCTLNLVQTAALADLIQDTTTAYHQTFGLELKVYPVQLSEGARCDAL